jgi:hypothetical protein
MVAGRSHRSKCHNNSNSDADSKYNDDDATTTINIISGMMAMPQACAPQASRHAVNSAGLMA